MDEGSEADPPCPHHADQSSPPSQHDREQKQEEDEEDRPRPYNIHLDESYDNLFERTYDSDSDFDPNEDYNPDRRYADWQLKILYERCMDGLCSPGCDHIIRYVCVNDFDQQRKSNDEEGEGDEGYDYGEEYEENIRYRDWLSTGTGDPMETEEEEG